MTDKPDKSYSEIVKKGYFLIVILTIVALGVFGVLYLYSKKSQGVFGEPPIYTQNKESDTKTPIDQMENVLEDRDTKKGILLDVTGGVGKGTASILRKGGKLFHKVKAELPAPPNGEFYEGWLVKKSPDNSFISTGKMTSEKAGFYEINYTALFEYPGYDFVVITLEKTDDQHPEKHIFEGEVK